jgi:hypothetical protein
VIEHWCSADTKALRPRRALAFPFLPCPLPPLRHAIEARRDETQRGSVGAQRRRQRGPGPSAGRRQCCFVPAPTLQHYWPQASPVFSFWRSHGSKWVRWMTQRGALDMKDLRRERTLSALPPEQMANWISLYAATGLCAALAGFGSAIAVGIEVVRRMEWNELDSLRSVALFGPRLWWRWQMRYLTATPVILGIVVYYGFSLSW